MHLIVHGVKSELFPVVDHDAAGLVLFKRQQRIVRVFGPVNQIF